MRWMLIPGVLLVFLAPCIFAGEVAVPRVPNPIPESWLKPADSPRIFCTPARLKEIRASLEKTPWRKAYLKEREAEVASFLKLSDEQLRALVPPPHSLFIYGLGMDLDPVHGRKMRWGGWAHPHVMYDVKGVAYPNAEWPDQGQGVVDPRTGKKVYFVAQANGQITQHLDKEIFPALADAWALTGDKRYAHIAAVLLDAVAAVYPTNRRGPMDYPTSAGDMDRGGRLDRPYYQVARGLMNYAFAVDMIADSGELNQPSAYGAKQSIRDHVIKGFLWNGAAYCLDFAARGHALHNGQADYEGGAAVVGALLGVRAFAGPMINGAVDFEHMLANNIGPDGFYVESSTLYANWTRHLYLDMAELMAAMRRNGWKDVPDPYKNPALIRFLGPEFDRLELGGHVPMIGDSGPDKAVVDPMRRFPVPPRVYNDQYLDGQMIGAWVRLSRGIETKEAARLLSDTYDGRPIAPSNIPLFERWYVYNLTPEVVAEVERFKPDERDFDTGSTFYGAKGLALLRGGEGQHRHGAQLLFGALHNHGQDEALTWTFFARGAEWSLDPGYFNTHFRFGWTVQSVAHQAMVVDERSVDKSRGGGALLAWHAGPTAQWAMASQPSAYAAEGVTQYERLIAQVQKDDGTLGYWLDVGRVAGGATRDDSFHSRMTQAAFNIALPAVDPSRPALYGRKDLGRLIRPDMRLEGFDDKSFYWAPPGDGYGFLGNPRSAAMPGTARAILSDPAWSKGLVGAKTLAMTVDFSGGEGRRFIVADGPRQKHFDFPSVPYILCRDSGPGASVFAKLIRLSDDEAADPIASFERLAVQSAPAGDKSGAGAAAWCVTWKDGRRDVWVVGDPARDGEVRITAAGLPGITTDGRVTLIRFDGAGKVVKAVASEASEVTVANSMTLHGQAAAVGTITAVDPDESPARFAVKWDGGTPPKGAGGSLLRVRPEAGEASTWRIASCDDRGVTLDQVKPWIGRTRLEPVAGKGGWYKVITPISQFDAPGGVINRAFALGRAVYDGRTPVGRIVDLSKDAGEMKLEAVGGALPSTAFDAAVLLASPGDEVTIPLELKWAR